MRVARSLARLVVVPVVCGLLLLPSCAYRQLATKLCCPDCLPAQKICAQPTVMTLACDLDHLEKHIDCYGSVVAQQPSVWGQARMTHHREQFEEQMAGELSKFKGTLQGSLSRSDQAYFAQANALGAAVSGRSAGLFAPRPRVVVNTNAATASGTKVEQPTGTVTVPSADVEAKAFEPFASSNFKRTDVRSGDQLKFKAQAESISLEPTIYLDQKARYLNHLNELRRINEGDDTADSPGYALNLIRVPVSVLPGSKTREGYAAEVTMTLTPNLSDELLPMTFRNLVLNDLVDQLGVPLTELVNDPEFHVLNSLSDEEYAAVTCGPDGAKALEDILKRRQDQPETAKSKTRTMAALERTGVKGEKAQAAALLATYAAKKKSRPRAAVPATKLRRAFLPFPPSHAPDIYGVRPGELIVRRTYATFEKDLSSNYPCDGTSVFVHLPTVQGYLREELNSAYKFLSDSEAHTLWSFCTPQLAQLIRARNASDVQRIRTEFFAAANRIALPALPDPPEVAECIGTGKLTVVLAWTIVVESALLNEQLVKDMQESAAVRGCGCSSPAPHPYYLPNPPPEARQAFNAYVQCRWPIHVFAIDPVTQQQNLADTFSARRETQLALSLAFASGQISTRSMTRYARRIELDMETIDLNNTAVGFSHGNETFGWRFYPRYQTPDIESNATVLTRDLLLGGPSRDALLRQRRLEPGQRECVAIVIMPSFVPTATLHVSSNWLALTHPKCKELSSTDAMRLSKAVKTIHNCSGNVGDADCYRDGDYQRLLMKAKQLEARLPLQTMQVGIPFKNTLGGFAMFNNGVTDLAPELYGWYGATEVRLDQPTTVFLVGNHFSVHQTRAIAGGQDVPSESRELLSRQVLKVTIPPNAVTVRDDERYYVEVRVATPYGVTQPLLIPTCKAKEAAEVLWSPTNLEVGFLYQGVGIIQPGEPIRRPGVLNIADATAPASAATANISLKFAVPYDKVPAVRVTDVPLKGGKFVLASDKVKELTDGVFARFTTVFGPETTNPPAKLIVAETGIDYYDSAKKALQVRSKATNALTISWVKAPK